MKFTYHVAPKNTCWWVNPAKTSDSPRQRMDILVGLNRIFIRDEEFAGRYCYQLVIGRLQILFAR